MSHLSPQLPTIPTTQLTLPSKSSSVCTDPGRAILHDSPFPTGMAIPYLARVGNMGESLYASSPMTPNTLGVEPSAFYPLGSGAPGLERSPEFWKAMHPNSMLYPIDPMMGLHPYGAFYGGLDLNNAARRKNATRETTSALKAWLYEHRKNPYPTKGEKIMLAIITKMTLTQVSTWFANARRRLKKESKQGYKDKDLDDSDVESLGSPNEILDGKLRSCSTSSNMSRKLDDEDDDDIDVRVTSDLSDISDDEDVPECAQKQANPSANQNGQCSSSAQNRLQAANGNSDPRNNPTQSNTRPKIWSIDEIMNKDKNSSDNSKTSPHKNPLLQSLSSYHAQNSNMAAQEHCNQDKLKINNETMMQSSHRKYIPETALNLAISDKNGLSATRTGMQTKPIATASQTSS